MCRHRKFRKDLRKESIMSDLPTGVYANPDGTTGQFTKTSNDSTKKSGSKPVRKQQTKRSANRKGVTYDVAKDSNLTFNPYINDIQGLPSASYPFMDKTGFVGRNLKPGNNAIFRIMRYLNPNDVQVSTLRKDFFDINVSMFREPYFQAKFQQLFENYNAISRMGNGIVLTQAHLWAYMWNAVVFEILKLQHKRFLVLFDKYAGKSTTELQKFIQAYFNTSEDAASRIISMIQYQRPRIDVLMEMVDKKVFIPNFGFIQYIADQMRYIYQDDRLLRVAFPISEVNNVYTTDFLSTQNGHKVAFIHPQETDQTMIRTGIQRYNLTGVEGQEIAESLPGNAGNGYDTGLISVRPDYNGNLLHYFDNPLAYTGDLIPPVPNAGNTNLSNLDTIFGIRQTLHITPGFHLNQNNAGTIDGIFDSITHMMNVAETLTNYSTTGAINVFARGAEPVDESIRFINPASNKDVESYLKSRIYYDGAIETIVNGANYTQESNVTSECGNGVNSFLPNNRGWRPLVIDPNFVTVVGDPSEEMKNFLRSQTEDYAVMNAPTPIAGEIDRPEIGAKYVTFEYTQYSLFIRANTTYGDNNRLELRTPTCSNPDHLGNDACFQGNSCLNANDASTALLYALVPEIGPDYDADGLNGFLVANPSCCLGVTATLATRHDWAIPYYANIDDTHTSDDDCAVICFKPVGGVLTPYLARGARVTALQNWQAFITQAGPAFDFDLNPNDQYETPLKRYFEGVTQMFDIIISRILDYDQYQSAIFTGWHILDNNPVIYSNLVMNDGATGFNIDDAAYDMDNRLVNGQALIMGWTHFNFSWAPEGKRQFYDEATNIPMMRMYFQQSLLDVGEAYRVGNRICTSPFKAWNFVNSQGKITTKSMKP